MELAHADRPDHQVGDWAGRLVRPEIAGRLDDPPDGVGRVDDRAGRRSGRGRGPAGGGRRRLGFAPVGVLGRGFVLDRLGFRVGVGVGVLEPLGPEDRFEEDADLVERLAEGDHAGGIAAEVLVIAPVELLERGDRFLEVVEERLVEGPGREGDLVVELLRGDLPLGDQGVHLHLILEPDVIGGAGLLPPEEGIRPLIHAGSQRRDPDDRRQHPGQEGERAESGFQVSVVDPGVIRVPERILDRPDQSQAVAEAREAEAAGEGLGDPGGDLDVLRLADEQVGPELDHSFPVGDLGPAPPVALGYEVVGAARLADLVILGLVGEVAPGWPIGGDRDEVIFDVKHARCCH